ncbi:MAG: hypothetical protein Q7S57_00605 [bacterium]|nr:hypothetical protein [bacterium]
MIDISNIPKKLVYSISSIAVVGILFGAYFATRGNIQPIGDIPVATVKPNGENNTFGSTFSNFILGRSADGSAIGSKTPLVRATKFSAGEKVGLRVQTSSEVVVAFPIELRFLRQDSSEETPSLQPFRQKFSIKPGLRSYCCLTIPKEAGNFSIGILRNNSFVGSIANIVVVPAKVDEGGSIFGL